MASLKIFCIFITVEGQLVLKNNNTSETPFNSLLGQLLCTFSSILPINYNGLMNDVAGTMSDAVKGVNNDVLADDDIA